MITTDNIPIIIENELKTGIFKDYIIPFLSPLLASFVGGLITIRLFKVQEKISIQNKLRLEFYNKNKEIFDNMIDSGEILKYKVEKLELFKEDKTYNIGGVKDILKSIYLLNQNIDEVLKCLNKNMIIFVPDKDYLLKFINVLNNIKITLDNLINILTEFIDKNKNKYSSVDLEVSNKIMENSVPYLKNTISDYVTPMLNLQNQLLYQIINGKFFFKSKDYKKIKKALKKMKIYDY